MYGTIYRFELKPGKEQELQGVMELESAEQDEGRRLRTAGMIACYVYKLDYGDYMGAVVWDTKDRYQANANDPAQDRWYRQFRELLESDPEWNDGEIVQATT